MKNSKYRPLEISIGKQESGKNYSTKKKYSKNPGKMRRKTNSVEPPDGIVVNSPHNQKYHRHHKSVTAPKATNFAPPKHKTKHYVMSQGNSELKQTLEEKLSVVYTDQMLIH